MHKSNRKFIQECEKSTSGTLSHRYIWTNHGNKRTTTEMGCANKDHIPAFKNTDQTRNQQIRMKPALTATKRPQTSRVHQNDSTRVLISGLRIQTKQSQPSMPVSPTNNNKGSSLAFAPTSDHYKTIDIARDGQQTPNESGNDYKDFKVLSEDELSTTDFKLYNRTAGFRFRKSQVELTKEEKKRIEKVLPCPHDPHALSGLYL